MEIPIAHHVIFGLLLLPASIVAARPPGPPPQTRIEVVTDRMHGIDVPDPYRWLEAQENSQTRAWISAQNVYTRTLLDAVPGREHWRTQLERLSRVDFQSAPRVVNGRYFYLRQSAMQDQAVIVVREGPDGSERVLVDPRELSSDGSVSALLWDVTADGRVLAWAKRKGGEDEFEIHFLDVDSGNPFAEKLPRGFYVYFFLLPDKSGFLYTRRRSEGTRVLAHRFGTPFSADRELFGAGIPDDRLIAIQLSTDGRFITAFVTEGAGQGARTRVYFSDRFADGGFQPLITDIDANFVGRLGGHTLFLRTTWNAQNGRLIAIDLDHPARANWREVIPESTGSVLLEALPVGRKLMVAFLHNVSTRLSVFEPDGKLLRDISLPTLGTGHLPEANRWESDEGFYSFQSFANPLAIYRYNTVTGEQTVWHKRNMPFDSDAIAAIQVWYRSKDGTRVPMFVVSKKETKLDGKRPVLLTGYGGYGSITSPSFSAVHAMWVNAGGILAVANIRGGGEFGDKWHRDGMLEKKQNSFDDFIAAAQWLIANNYTRAAKLAIRGASNGGMLVAVAAMQRPDLFRAVICENPHLDMLRYHKFMKAAPWVHEYGNPDVAEEFAYIRRYSPYHHVRPGERYPAMLFTTGDADTRVAPLHARKMTARMQAASRSGLPVLLRYSLNAGHMGTGAMSQLLDQQVDELAFLYSQLGLLPPPVK
jgi:prolyl oligopeptidase